VRVQSKLHYTLKATITEQVQSSPYECSHEV
jgi:hypothetical protein